MRCACFAALLALVAGCRTPPAPPRPDPEIERLAAAGRSAHAAGLPDRAAENFQRAVERARLTDDNAEIARAAYNLAVSLAGLRQWQAAGHALDEAALAFSAQPPLPLEIPQLRIKIKRGSERLYEAKALAQATLEAYPPARKPDWRRADIQIMLADMLCDAGEFSQAGTWLDALALADDMPAVVLADHARTKARIARNFGHRPDAAGLFDEAAALYRRAGRFGSMAECLAAAGRAYADMRETATAADRLYRAARSLYQQGNLDQALALADQALPMARRTDNDALLTALQRMKAALEEKSGNAE